MADDYKAKLEQFFGLVPKSAVMTQRNNKTGTEYWGEVQSGTPVIQVQKGQLDAAKKLIQDAIDQKKIVTNSTFQTLTGLTHEKLLTNWQGGGFLTSCNAFVMKAGEAMGVLGLGDFYVEEKMTKLGKRHCWIKPSSGEKPQFGDVFESRSHTPGNDYLNLHVGISLKVEGDDWWTIEGGQCGPGSGVDKVARVKKKYDTTHLLGWVDMRLFTSGQPALPEWLLGTWIIYSGDRNYVYSFNRYGEVTQKAYRPNGAPNDNVPNLDTGKILSVMGDTIKVRWDCEGGIETFTYDRWNSFPGINERMNGAAADRSSMNGIRL